MKDILWGSIFEIYDLNNNYIETLKIETKKYGFMEAINKIYKTTNYRKATNNFKLIGYILSKEV